MRQVVVAVANAIDYLHGTGVPQLGEFGSGLGHGQFTVETPGFTLGDVDGGSLAFIGAKIVNGYNGVEAIIATFESDQYQDSIVSPRGIEQRCRECIDRKAAHGKSNATGNAQGLEKIAPAPHFVF